MEIRNEQKFRLEKLTRKVNWGDPSINRRADSREMTFEGTHWTKLTQVRVQQHVLVNKMMTLLIQQKARKC
jgi:hypothetical protein